MMLRFIIKRNSINKRFYSTNNMSTTARQVTANQLSAWLATQESKPHNDLIVVDVRERNEIEQHGKIKGSLNVPFALDLTMFSAGLSDLNKHGKVMYTNIIIDIFTKYYDRLYFNACPDVVVTKLLSLLKNLVLKMFIVYKEDLKSGRVQFNLL